MAKKNHLINKLKDDASDDNKVIKKSWLKIQSLMSSMVL